MPNDAPLSPLTLNITGLTVDEIKEIAAKIREIEQRNPDRTFFMWINGFEKLSVKQAIKKVMEIFPKKKNFEVK